MLHLTGNLPANCKKNLSRTVVPAGVLHVDGDGAAGAERGGAEGGHVLRSRLAGEAEPGAGPGATRLVATLLAGAIEGKDRKTSG